MEYKEVIHFIDALLTEKGPHRKRKPKLDWIGGLKAYRFLEALLRQVWYYSGQKNKAKTVRRVSKGLSGGI